MNLRRLHHSMTILAILFLDKQRIQIQSSDKRFFTSKTRVHNKPNRARQPTLGEAQENA